MRWLVGIDLRERNSGVVHMAAWLRRNTRGTASQSAVAVHIVDDCVRRSQRVPDELPDAVRARMKAIAERSGVADPFAALRVATATTAEEGLAELAIREGFDAVVVGRIAPIEGRTIRRLGSVTRRLLRRLEVPVMVVPPQLVADEIGDGPILLATDLSDASVPAARVALQLAQGLARELVVVHVDVAAEIVAHPLGAGLRLVSTPRRTLAEVRHGVHEQARGAVEAVLLEGPITESVMAEARQRDAPLVVCGSRQLAVEPRIFASSNGGELSRWTDCAVLIVPER